MCLKHNMLGVISTLIFFDNKKCAKNDLYTLICLLHILEMWIIRAAVNLSFKGVIMHVRVFHRLDICSLVQRFILNRHISVAIMSFCLLGVTLLHPCLQYFSLLIYKFIFSNNSVTWGC